MLKCHLVALWGLWLTEPDDQCAGRPAALLVLNSAPVLCSSSLSAFAVRKTPSSLPWLPEYFVKMKISPFQHLPFLRMSKYTAVSIKACARHPNATAACLLGEACRHRKMPRFWSQLHPMWDTNITPPPPRPSSPRPYNRGRGSF